MLVLREIFSKGQQKVFRLRTTLIITKKYRKENQGKHLRPGGLKLWWMAEETVTLKKVKYDALSKAIAQHKGKVVVVDFWATY